MTITVPLDSEVQKVRADTGMDYLQAYRHVQGRMLAVRAVVEQQREAVERCVKAWAARSSRHWEAR